MSAEKTILITGASGFIGTWLAEKAFEEGYDLVGIDTRLPLKPHYWSAFATSSLENTEFTQLINGRDIFAVFHLAGGASVGSSISDPYSDFYSLLPGTAKLALYVSKVHPQARLYLFSSAAVYGNPLKIPITVESLVAPVSPYGAHKAITEELLLHYSNIFRLNITILRIFSVYGQGLKKQIVWDVGQKALDAFKKGENKITLSGTGKETRDFIYVEDLCKAVLILLKKEHATRVEYYNIASGTETSIAELSNLLISHLCLNVNVSFNGKTTAGDPLNWRADISGIRGCGFNTDYELSSGLKKVSAWMQSSTEKIF